MTIEELKDLIRKEGYDPTIDKDGNIFFKVNGCPLFICTEERDPSYLIISCPFRVKPNGEKSELDALKVADQVEFRLKCVKCTLRKISEQGFHYSASIESFVDAEDLSKHLHRYINVINSAVLRITEAILSD